MRHRHKPSKPRLISLVGESGSGKTTLITKLIKELNRRGLRVGAVKHSRSCFTIDPDGKDSARFRKAGAQTVLLLSPTSLGLVSDRRKNFSPEDAAAHFFKGLDIVLVEGWKESPLPKIIVSSANTPPRAVKNVVAEIGKRGTIPNVPLFSPNDIAALADFIVSLNHLS
jgi:molybdopterin-guanine dinucleotide biosynthesis protein MobB